MIRVEATPEAIARAAEILRAGGLVAFPTETVYGLGADASDALAVARIFEAKGRPRFNPLIVHTEPEAARRLAVFDAAAERLAAAFWPGPLTLVLPLRRPSPIADLALAGLDSIGLRVPAHPVAQALIAAAGRPIAAPSANRSGHVSPTTATHVEADLGARVDLILDGGPTPVGLESTVAAVEPAGVRLLRPGGVTRAEIEAAIGAPLLEATTSDPDRPASPGQLASHYAPRARLRLDAREVRPGEALLAFGPPLPGPAVAQRNLSPSGDLREAAANLFGALRELDATGAPIIAVAAIPVDGLGEAINDRLNRAAAPRPST